jgi:hypothetical protein
MKPESCGGFGPVASGLVGASVKLAPGEASLVLLST